MNKNLNIYLVKPKHYHSVEEIAGIFDTKEKAEDFISRFKTRPDLEIQCGVLNPEYFVDKLKDPYCMTFNKTGLVPFSYFVSDLICHADAALQQEYRIDFFGKCTIDDGKFFIMLMAEDLETAIELALEIRTAAVARGEWELAWYNYNEVIMDMIDNLFKNQRASS